MFNIENTENSQLPLYDVEEISLEEAMSAWSAEKESRGGSVMERTIMFHSWNVLQHDENLLVLR